MRLALTTLCINEMEWLPSLYEQHKNWPDLVRWVFVESADVVYAETNPELVTKNGLSTDGTSEFLQKLAEKDNRIRYIPYGTSQHPRQNLSQGKCSARNKYLEAMESVEPDYFLILDADEFYTYAHQARINEIFIGAKSEVTSFCFPYRNVWRPESIMEQPLFAHEVVGGFWGIPHCHGWRWFPGLRYNDYHMTPERDGIPLSKEMGRYLPENTENCPYCVHMAFASSLVCRKAKHRYYENRGELRDRRRAWYTRSRKQFEVWKPGDRLIYGARVVPYEGTVPECFSSLVSSVSTVSQS